MKKMDHIGGILKEILGFLICLVLVLFTALAEIAAILILPCVALYLSNSLWIFVLLTVIECLAIDGVIKVKKNRHQ